MKSFPQGTVRIEAGETFDLDITWNDLWNDGATLDAPNILVQIGKTKLVAKANADGFGFELGPRNSIFCAWLPTVSAL